MEAAQGLVNKFVDLIIDPAILLIFSFAFVVFLYGLVEFMWDLNQGGETRKGTQHMLYGIVGMLIMVSVWGIIALLDNTFGLQISNPDVSRLENITAPANFFGH